MLKLVSFVCFLFLFISADAQNHHFIYFESQNNKPFFLKHENKVYSSSKKNYINLNQLNTGEVHIKVDIENERDLSFTISINDNDGGYILKQNANNDWVLFDFLNFSTLVQDKFIQPIVTNNQAIIIEPTTTIEATKTIDPSLEFSDSTKQTINPQSILIPQPVLLDSIKKTEEFVANKIDSSTIIITNPTKEIYSSLIDTAKTVTPIIITEKNIEPQIVQENTLQFTSIEKIHEAKMLTGIEQIYVTTNGNETDTISLFIPFKKTIKTDTVKEVIKPLIDEKKMVSQNIDHSHLKEVNCIETATDFDYNNFISELQKNPVIKNKLSIAANVLKKKCYSTSQLQKLSVMFMYDKAKLEFFKLGINSVSDIKNFHYLENEIKDDGMRQEFLDLLKP